MEADTEEIRQDTAIDMKAAQGHLDALLQEGLDSGPSTPMTAQDWQEIRVKVDKQC